MKRIATIGIAIGLALPITVAVSPIKVEAITSCGVYYIVSPPGSGNAVGGKQRCYGLQQGPPGQLGEWQRVKASCSNAPSVFYFGPKVYNDGQWSEVYPPCPPGTYVYSVGGTSGYGA